jgi:hypothetical protein
MKQMSDDKRVRPPPPDGVGEATYEVEMGIRDKILKVKGTNLKFCLSVGRAERQSRRTMI